MKRIRAASCCLLILLCFTLTGCWNSRDMNSLTFISAMGFDKVDSGFLLTVQLINTRAIASQKTVRESPTVVYTQEGNDVFEMLRRMSTQSPRKINVTHLESVVFSEDFAKEGISGILDFLSREHQFRSDFYFLVAKDITANRVLTTVTELEINSSKKIDSSLKASENVWAATKATKRTELINQILSDGDNPVMTGVIMHENQKSDSYSQTDIDSLKDTQADPLILMGLALFSNDKFVGWFNENETKGYSYLTNNVMETVDYVEDPSIGKFTLESTHAKAKNKVYLENGKPCIRVFISVEAYINTAVSDLDITKESNLKIIENLAVKKVKMLCYQSLSKAKLLHCDVYGFGDSIHRAYPAMWKQLKTNWEEEFPQLPVTIEVNFKINDMGTISNSLFAKDNK